MTSASGPRFRVALQGLSAFERSAMVSYFRLSADRFPAYEQADSALDADFVVADADHPGVVDQIVAGGRAADTVFIGAQAPDGALAWMMRPIDPMHVLRELDATVVLREPAASEASRALREVTFHGPAGRA